MQDASSEMNTMKLHEKQFFKNISLCLEYRPTEVSLEQFQASYATCGSRLHLHVLPDVI